MERKRGRKREELEGWGDERKRIWPKGQAQRRRNRRIPFLGLSEAQEFQTEE